MTIDEFVQHELERTGKRLFTVREVIEMTSRYIEEQKAAAPVFPGWLEGEELELAKVAMAGAPTLFDDEESSAAR